MAEEMTEYQRNRFRAINIRSSLEEDGLVVLFAPIPATDLLIVAQAGDQMVLESGPGRVRTFEVVQGDRERYFAERGPDGRWRHIEILGRIHPDDPENPLVFWVNDRLPWIRRPPQEWSRLKRLAKKTAGLKRPPPQKFPAVGVRLVRPLVQKRVKLNKVG